MKIFPQLVNSSMGQLLLMKYNISYSQLQGNVHNRYGTDCRFHDFICCRNDIRELLLSDDFGSASTATDPHVYRLSSLTMTATAYGGAGNPGLGIDGNRDPVSI